MAESQKNLLRVEIPEDGGDAAMRSSSSKGDISTDAKTRSKFSPAVVLNKLNPLEIAKMPGKAVNKLRSRNTVDPRKMAARNAQFNSAMAREGDKSYSKNWRRVGSKRGGGGKGGGEEDRREIDFDPQHGTTTSVQTSNLVITSKYNVLTFLPIFLFEMFSRVAYLYFLLQAALSWWSVVSPFGGVGATAALVFVLVVAAIKAIWEDVKRHREDETMNRSIAHRANPDGSVTDIPWTDVRVGDALLVRDDELFPADLVCLQTELPDRVCFIRTTNLDGETNLKIRKPLDFKGVAADTVAEVMRLHIKLSAEGPNKNLHRFRGLATVLHDDYATLPVSPGAAKPVWEAPPSAAGAGQASPFDRAGSGGGAPPLALASSTTSSASPQLQIPITMNEMLLRGCMLKNSGAVLGMVVYTGRESRIQMNAARTPNKVGSFDRFLNLQIGLVIAFQLALVVFCASANLVWQHRMGGDRPYLALNAHVEGIYGNGFVQWLINLLTFWILLSYLVPISLFVTLEIVKFWQGFVFINLDPAMKDPVTREHARCRNSGLNEDLGRVEYIFSDKTGTLTSNEMELRAIAIKGVAYGDVDFLLEKHPELGPAEALRRFDPRLDAACAHLHRSKSLRGIVDMGGSSAELLSRGLDDDESGNGGAAAPPSAFASGTIAASTSPSLSDLGPHLVDFWTNICICQSLILEADPAGPGRPPVYQGPSPDEVALVAAARRLGFEFKARSQSGVTISVLGEDAEFEVLNVLEYSSERGCMSVIARAPDGNIRLYCKGSDAKVMRKIRGDTDPALLRATEGNLHAFARKGLRTLLLGTRILEDDWHAEWDARYQEAAAAFEDRDARLDALGDEVERDLELVGVTAIEDKLQDGVPEAIQTLLEAGIRVWMITGDKMETAVNIAISCHLVGDMDSIMMLVVDEKAFGGGGGGGGAAGATTAEQQQPAIQVVSADGAVVPASDASQEPSSVDPIKKPAPSPAAREAERLLDDFLARLIELYRASTGDATVRDAADLPHEWQQAEMAVDGPTLTYILGDAGLARKLALLAAHCSGVVVSRSSPSQKAGVVRLMTRYEMDRVTGTKRGLRRWYARYKRRLSGKMLSIGDGANDVAMLQTADVGVGIMGKEGRQATNNADYAISQFRFLVRLLLVHGNLSYYRLARLIKYSFYKNITFAFVLFYYQFYNGFSGQSLVDSITAAVFNVVFTSVPILLFAVLDRPVRDLETYIHFPKLYDKSDSNTLTTLAFWKTGVLLAVEHGAICFFIPYYAVATSGQNNITDVYSLGKVTFVAMLGTVTLEVALIARYWTWLFAVFVALSYFLVYPYMVVFPLIELAAEIYDPANVGVAEVVLGSPTFWFSIIVCYLLSFGIRYAERTYEWAYRPQDTMIIAEIERENEALGKTWMDRRMDEASRKRLESLGVEMVARPGRGSDSDTSDEERHELRSGTADSAEPGLENVVVHAAPRADGRDALPSPGRG